MLLLAAHNQLPYTRRLISSDRLLRQHRRHLDPSHLAALLAEIFLTAGAGASAGVMARTMTMKTMHVIHSQGIVSLRADDGRVDGRQIIIVVVQRATLRRPPCAVVP